MTANTFFYFFSTVAQCLAAITALTLVAIQMRITFLDNILTAAKRTLITGWHHPNSTGAIEDDMAAYTATEILKIGRGKENTSEKIKPRCDALRKAIDNLQDYRREARHLLLWLILPMLLTLLEIPFSEFFYSLSICFQKYILACNTLLLVIVLVFTIRALYTVLDVKLKRIK